MQITYDEVADGLYIQLKNEKPHESETVQEGVIVDYNEDGYVTGLEILGFSGQNIDLNRLIGMKDEEIISMVVRK